MFNIPDYQCYFSSRKSKKGGGVMIAVSNELISHECNIFRYKFPSLCELIAVYVKNIRLVWVTIYRPPSCNNDDSKALFEAIGDAVEKCKTVIITGDFNLHQID